MKRLREPSTWAGIGLVISSAAQAWATKDPAAVGAVFAGLAGILLRERAP